MKFVPVILVALFGVSGWAREVRKPLPPRRPPIVARTNVVRTVKAVRLAAEKRPACVDVLIAYDRAAALWADWKGGGVTNFAVEAVAQMNVALTNSLVSSALAFRLVGVARVDAVAPSRWGGTDFDAVLESVTYGDREWNAVRTERDRIGADIVVTMVDTGSAYGTTGLSWALCDETYDTFSDYAFSVCAIRAVADSHTMTHEVGHLFGAGHSDRQREDPGPLLRNYSSGYYFETNGVPCRTIMAYDDDGFGNYYNEAPYFSAPNLFLDGVAVGTTLNDNARTLRETSAHVASFRPTLSRFEYGVRFYVGGASSAGIVLPCDEVSVLSCPRFDALLGRQPNGWECSNGRRYDNGMLVFNLAKPGETVTMTAIWK